MRGGRVLEGGLQEIPQTWGPDMATRSGPGGEHLGSSGEDPPELKLVPQIGQRQRKKNARIVDVVTEISF